MTRRIRIVIVDRDNKTADYLLGLFDPDTFDVRHVVSGAEALDLSERSFFVPQAVLLDTPGDCQKTLETISLLKRLAGDVHIVLMGGVLPGGFMLQAGRSGVSDFLAKPIFRQDVEALCASIRQKISRPEDLPPITVPARPQITEFNDGSFFLAASPAMLDIARQIIPIASADVPVLITGESGVGKEVIAQMLHHHSIRSTRNLLKVNCAALPADLLESELFGYEPGAFTGALKAKPGKFEQCDKGTILLDEIGEMSAPLQAKLLHVLQDGRFSRLGSRTDTKVDVRVIAATNINIEQAITDRQFREDLYYRLNAFVIHVPPLRERREEIPYLLRELSRRLAATHNLEPVDFSQRLLSAALEYRWPGNLRELGNFVKRYLIMRDEPMALVDLQHKDSARYNNLPYANAPKVAAAAKEDAGLKATVRSVKGEAEIKILQGTLEKSNWNRRIAAETLQISYKALLYKIRQYDLQAPVEFVARRSA